jgi:pimeloyl-ACP methyl ester carboxylesterase
MDVIRDRVETGGFAMEYFRFGEGDRKLVILPGLSVQSVMNAAEAVAAAYAGLAEEFTIYVFDRRAQLPPVYSVEDMARDTAAAMEALGLRSVCLFGASQGGMMAQVIAIEHPELVGKMVLGSTSPHMRPEQYRVAEQWIRLAEAGDGVALYLDFGREIYPPAVFEASRDLLVSAGETVTKEELARFIILARGMEGFDVSDRLDQIACPVLAIGVYEDEVVDDDATLEIAEKLDHRPDFRLYLYVGYGHAAFDTAPDYRERILRFFRGEES